MSLAALRARYPAYAGVDDEALERALVERHGPQWADTFLAGPPTAVSLVRERYPDYAGLDDDTLSGALTARYGDDWESEVLGGDGAPTVDEPGLLERVGGAIATGAREAASGLLQAGGTLLTSTAPDPEAQARNPYAVRHPYLDALGSGREPILEAGTALEDLAGEVAPPPSDDPLLNQGLFSTEFTDIPEWVLLQAARGLPYMAGAAIPGAGIPLVGGSLAGTIARGRAEAEGRPGEVTGGDLAIGAAGAIPSAILERVGVRTVLGRPRPGAGIGSEVARRAGLEAATEAVQEPIQYGAETIGTAAGFDPYLALEAAAGGALVGGAVGGGVGLPAAALRRPDDPGPPPGVPGDAVDELLALPAPARPMLPPPGAGPHGTITPERVIVPRPEHDPADIHVPRVDVTPPLWELTRRGMRSVVEPELDPDPEPEGPGPVAPRPSADVLPFTRERRREPAGAALETGEVDIAGAVPLGQRQVVSTPDREARVDTEFAIVDASDLVASHDPQSGHVDPRYPAELQPRKRERLASRAWVEEESGRLDPEWLADSPSTDRGAPIVSPEGFAESGNGRLMIIQRAYQRGTAGRYQAMVEERARAAGVDTSGMDQPVLVRVRTGEASVGYTRASNRPDTAELSPVEQAMMDEERLGSVDAGTAEAAALDLVRGMGGAERGAMLDSRGALSKRALERGTNALLWRGYGSERLLEEAAEATDPESKRVLEATIQAAPVYAQLEGDFADHVVGALEALRRARAAGQRTQAQVDDYLANQTHFFSEDAPSDVAVEIASGLNERFRSAPQMAEYLRAIGQTVAREESAAAEAGPGLFGGEPPPGPSDLDLVRLAVPGREPAPGPGSQEQLGTMFAGPPLERRQAEPGGDFTARTEGVRQRLEALGRKQFGQGFRLEATRPGEVPSATPALQLARIALESSDTMASLGHEGVHILRAHGAFGEGDWNRLAREARDKWIGEHRVRELYPDANEDLQVEEAVAEAYGQWLQGRKVSPWVQRVFERLKAWLGQARSWLAGQGYRTSDAIFRDVERGRMAVERPGPGLDPAVAPARATARRALTDEEISARRDEFSGYDPARDLGGGRVDLQRSVRREVREFGKLAEEATADWEFELPTDDPDSEFDFSIGTMEPMESTPERQEELARRMDAVFEQAERHFGKRPGDASAPDLEGSGAYDDLHELIAEVYFPQHFSEWGIPTNEFAASLRDTGAFKEPLQRLWKDAFGDWKEKRRQAIERVVPRLDPDRFAERVEQMRERNKDVVDRFVSRSKVKQTLYSGNPGGFRVWGEGGEVGRDSARTDVMWASDNPMVGGSYVTREDYQRNPKYGRSYELAGAREGEGGVHPVVIDARRKVTIDGKGASWSQIRAAMTDIDVEGWTGDQAQAADAAIKLAIGDQPLSTRHVQRLVDRLNAKFRQDGVPPIDVVEFKNIYDMGGPPILPPDSGDVDVLSKTNNVFIVFGDTRIKRIDAPHLDPESPDMFFRRQRRQAAGPGARHVPLERTVRAGRTPPPAPTRRQRLRRRQDILAPLARALGTKFYARRLPGKQRAGYYRTDTGELRTKRLNDAEVVAHEVAHLVDSRVWGPDLEKRNKGYPERPWLRDAAMREEVEAISYDRSKLHEGFAEGVRLWMTQPDEGTKAAPKLMRFLDRWSGLKDNAAGPAMRKARDELRAWYGAHPAERLASKIGRGDRGRVRGAVDAVRDVDRRQVGELATAVRIGGWDDLAGIYEAERAITGQREPDGGAYQTARLSRGVTGMIEGVYEFGAPVVKRDGAGTFQGFDYKGKSFGEVLDLVPRADRADWERYIAARSASELLEQGRENLFTPEEIKAGVALGKGKPHFEEAFGEWLKLNRDVVKAAVDLGVINERDRAKWNRELYVPFHRVDTRSSVHGGPDRPGVGKVWQRLSGGTANIRNPIENMRENIASLVRASVVNDARRQVIDDLRKGGEASAQFLVKLEKRPDAVKVATDAVVEQLRKALGRDEALTPEQRAKLDAWAVENGPTVAFWRMVEEPAILPGERVVTVLRNGRPEWYEVADPLLFRSLSRMSRPARKGLFKAANGVRRLMQGTITLGLDFMGANYVRDQLSAAGYSRAAYRPVYDGGKGLFSRLAKDPDYQAWLGAGGSSGSFSGADDLTHARVRGGLRAFYRRHGISLSSVLRTPVELFRALDQASRAVEEATRLGEFKRVQSRGASRRTAAYAAREVSTDFSVRGAHEGLNAFQDSVMFLSAGMAGMERAYRGLVKGRGDKAGGRAKLWMYGAMLAAFSGALYAWNRDNPWYESLEDWDKDAHWHFFVRTRSGPAPRTRSEAQAVYQHWRVPKFWDVGALASLSERMMETALGDQPKVGKGLAHMGKVVADQFKLGFVPSAIEPPLEIAANRSFFTGRPIEPPSVSKLPAAQRATPYTSAIGRAAGEAGLSPAKVDHLLRGYFGFFGSLAIQLSDMAAGEAPSRRATEMPGVRRFAGRNPGRTQAETDYWDMLREAESAHAGLRAYKRDGDAQGVEKRARESRYYKVLKTVQQQLAAGQKVRRDVLRSDMSPAEKRRILDEQQRVKNDMLIELMEAIEAEEGNRK